MKTYLLKKFLGGVIFSLGIFGGIILLVKAAGLTATTGEPLTVSKWTDMAANFFWGSGSGGVYYNGKVGIGTSSPNKSLHIKTSAGTNAELDLQSGDLPHWAIYQDESTKSLSIWNGVIRTSISTGGNLNAQGICINGDCKTAWSQVGSSATLNYTGTCDSAHKGASGIISNTYKVCNGIMWIDIVPTQNYFAGAGTLADPYRLYSESAAATTVTATSCNYYNLNSYSSVTGASRMSGSCGVGGVKECLTSGIYRIDIDGAGGNSAFNVYCDMSTEYGGWTLLAYTNGYKSIYSNGTVCTSPTTNCAGDMKKFGITTTLLDPYSKMIIKSGDGKYVSFQIGLGSPIHNIFTQGTSYNASSFTHTVEKDTYFGHSYGTYTLGWRYSPGTGFFMSFGAAAVSDDNIGDRSTSRLCGRGTNTQPLDVQTNLSFYIK